MIRVLRTSDLWRTSVLIAFGMRRSSYRYLANHFRHYSKLKITSSRVTVRLIFYPSEWRQLIIALFTVLASQRQHLLARSRVANRFSIPKNRNENVICKNEKNSHCPVCPHCGFHCALYVDESVKNVSRKVTVLNLIFRFWHLKCSIWTWLTVVDRVRPSLFKIVIVYRSSRAFVNCNTPYAGAHQNNSI